MNWKLIDSLSMLGKVSKGDIIATGPLSVNFEVKEIRGAYIKVARLDGINGLSIFPSSMLITDGWWLVAPVLARGGSSSVHGGPFNSSVAFSSKPSLGTDEITDVPS